MTEFTARQEAGRMRRLICRVLGHDVHPTTGWLSLLRYCVRCGCDLKARPDASRNRTAHSPDTSCTYCGESAPVRVIDHDGYIPDELICKDCFAHEVMCWDDLPKPKLPEEEL